MPKKIILWSLAGFFCFAVGSCAQFVFDFVPKLITLDQSYLGGHGSIVLNALARSTFFADKGFKTSKIYHHTLRYVERRKKSRDLYQVAVFYQDLANLERFSINGDLGFSAASLMKVPVLISYLRASRTNPGIISEKIVYDPKKYFSILTQTVEPPEPLVPGEAYSIDLLLERMATLSDNASTDMLVAAHPELSLPSLLREMGLKLYENEYGDYIISAAQYSSIFRILYFKEFLDDDLSHLALDVLRNSKYKSGLEQKLPEGTIVAHKFGERTIGEVHQLHDCGIIYHPKRPYVLCVMTRGKEFLQLQEIIQDISELIYNEVSDSW